MTAMTNAFKALSPSEKRKIRFLELIIKIESLTQYRVFYKRHQSVLMVDAPYREYFSGFLRRRITLYNQQKDVKFYSMIVQMMEVLIEDMEDDSEDFSSLPIKEQNTHIRNVSAYMGLKTELAVIPQYRKTELEEEFDNDYTIDTY